MWETRSRRRRNYEFGARPEKGEGEEEDIKITNACSEKGGVVFRIILNYIQAEPTHARLFPRRFFWNISMCRGVKILFSATATVQPPESCNSPPLERGGGCIVRKKVAKSAVGGAFFLFFYVPTNQAMQPSPLVLRKASLIPVAACAYLYGKCVARSVFSSFFPFSRKGIWSRGENPSASTSESNPGYFYLFSYLWHLGNWASACLKENGD